MRLNVIKIMLIRISRNKNGIINVENKAIESKPPNNFIIFRIVIEMIIIKKFIPGPANATFTLSIRGFLKFLSLIGTGLNIIKGSLKAI